MKKLLIIGFAFILLTGCSSTRSEENLRNDSKFIIIEENFNGWWVVYDKDTLVMYTVSKGSVLGYFTLLVDKDGQPLLYERVSTDE